MSQLAVYLQRLVIILTSDMLEEAVYKLNFITFDDAIYSFGSQ